MSDDNKVLKANLRKILGVAAFSNPSIAYYQSTGSLIFDLAILNWKKVGGIPGGKYVDIYGKPGAGKSAIGCRIGAQVQREGGLFVYVNTNEQGFNPDFYAATCGVRTDEDFPGWLLLNAFSLNSAWDALETIVEARETSDYPTFILIDSISGSAVHGATMDMKSAKEASASASGAKFLHEAFRRGVLYYSNGSKVTIAGIRHQTETPRPFAFGDHMTHGSAPEYYSWLQLKVSKEMLEDKKTGEHTGSWIKVKITRSKVGVAGEEVSLPFYFATGFSEGLELIQLLMDVGVIPPQPSDSGKATGRFIWDGKALYVFEMIQQYATSEVMRDAVREKVLSLHGADLTLARAEKKKRGKK